MSRYEQFLTIDGILHLDKRDIKSLAPRSSERTNSSYENSSILNNAYQRYLRVLEVVNDEEMLAVVKKYQH